MSLTQNMTSGRVGGGGGGGLVRIPRPSGIISVFTKKNLTAKPQTNKDKREIFVVDLRLPFSQERHLRDTA